jgi:uncharacterized protein (DUF58 family)
MGWPWPHRRGRADEPAGAITLRHRSIFILPTRLGLAFAGMLVLMWIGAVNYQNNLAFLLTFLLAGVYLAAMRQVFQNLAGVELQAQAADPVFAGDSARFPVRLANARRHPRIAIELGIGRDPPAAWLDVDAAGVAHTTVPVAASRRGRLGPGRMTISTRYPGGLFRAWSRFHPDVECLVYPAPETGRASQPPGSGGRGAGTETGAGEDDFSGLRAYRPGDSVRRIAWKATHARDLQIKTFTGAAPSRQWLCWEQTQGSVEARLSRLCRWIIDADAEGRSYGLDLPGVRIEPGNGNQHRHRCLAALALFGGAPE